MTVKKDTCKGCKRFYNYQDMYEDPGEPYDAGQCTVTGDSVTWDTPRCDKRVDKNFCQGVKK